MRRNAIIQISRFFLPTLVSYIEHIHFSLTVKKKLMLTCQIFHFQLCKSCSFKSQISSLKCFECHFRLGRYLNCAFTLFQDIAHELRLSMEAAGAHLGNFERGRRYIRNRNSVVPLFRDMSLAKV